MNEQIEKLEHGLMICEATGTELVHIEKEDAEKILGLLKEQEAIQVPEDKINKCECGETVCRYWHPKFCGFCGRKLLWY